VLSGAREPGQESERAGMGGNADVVRGLGGRGVRGWWGETWLRKADVSADARAVMVLMAKPAIEAGGQVTVE
jgi:hypothetical protein